MRYYSLCDITEGSFLKLQVLACEWAKEIRDGLFSFVGSSLTFQRALFFFLEKTEVNFA